MAFYILSGRWLPTPPAYQAEYGDKFFADSVCVQIEEEEGYPPFASVDSIGRRKLAAAGGPFLVIETKDGRPPSHWGDENIEEDGEETPFSSISDALEYIQSIA